MRLPPESLHDWLNTNPEQMKEQTAVGREAYIYFLRHVALMPFTPEQLLVMARTNGNVRSPSRHANKLAIKAS